MRRTPTRRPPSPGEPGRFRSPSEPSRFGDGSIQELIGLPHGQELHDPYEERLRDNTTTPVPDQVVFRLDWPAWLAILSERDQRIIRVMALSETTSPLSHRFGICPARISQLREFHDDWQRFCDGDEPAANSG